MDNQTNITEWPIILQQLQERYRLKIIPVHLDNRVLEIVKVNDINELLDQIEDVDQLPFWAELWPASIGMAQFIWQHQELFKGKTVLELGAGVGLAGIAAKLTGAEVIQSDFIEMALKFTQLNCLRNQVPVGSLLLADWRDFPIGEKPVDWIIGSDILYEKTLHSYLWEIFQRMLKPNGTLCLADPGRDYARQFITAIIGSGWTKSGLKTPVFHEEQSYQIDIYQLKPPGNQVEPVSL